MSQRPARPRIASAIRAFLESESAAGLILMGAAAAALVVANSPARAAYFGLLHVDVGPLSIAHWINDALMALFFLLVGLEIKREFVDGELARWSSRLLPILAATAGMIVPALVYLAITDGSPAMARGWAIPAATDIAFAVGVLALLGKRAPASLKLLLVTIAIADDLGAVAIIALAYSGRLDLGALAAAAGVIALMAALNRRGVTSLAPYLALGAALWTMVHLSGIHATVAGVLTAFLVPLQTSPGRPDTPGSPLHRLEHGLAPWVGYAIVPLFGFTNAGVDLTGATWATLLAPIPLGIAGGLFLGKQAGVYLSIRLAGAAGLAARPAHATWRQVWGMSLLTGIGFTMSLFIGGLAFAEPGASDQVRIGVLGGSLLSALAGFIVLRTAPLRPRS